MKSYAFIALLALAFCPAAARADSNKVSCEGFSLAFDGPSISKDCSEETVNQGRLSAEVKHIYVKGSDFLLNLVYLAAGHNGYFYDAPPRDLFMSSWGQQLETTEWGDTKSIAGYETAIFKLQGSSGPLKCFAFAKFSGIPHGELEGPPGYVKKAQGFIVPKPCQIQTSSPM